MKHIVFLIALAFSCGAENLPLSKVAKRLDGVEAERVLAQVNNGQTSKTTTRSASISASQADGVVEVVTSNDFVRASFVTTRPLVSGTTIAFQMRTPLGDIVSLSAWRVETFGQNTEYSIYQNIWAGSFPDIYPSGDTVFEVLLVSPVGRVTAASGTASIRSCCSPTLLDRADVTADGTAVNITGQFSGLVVAMVSGVPVDVVFPATPSPKPTQIATVSLLKFGGYGQHTLTICSEGNCTSRVIYISPQSGGPRG